MSTPPRNSSSEMDLSCHMLFSNMQRQLDELKENVDRRLDRQESQSERRHEDIKKDVATIRDMISSGPQALSHRVTLVEEKTATLTRISSFIATATVTTALGVVAVIITTALHLR